MITMNTLKMSVLALFCFTSFTTFAQKSKSTKKTTAPMEVYHQKWELGILGGGIQYLGDLNDIGTKSINPAIGAALRYHFNDNFALRTNFIGGKLTGDDANSDKNKARNFNFKANGRELAILAEYDLIGKRRWANIAEGEFRKTLSPYLFGGIAATSSLPETNYTYTSTNAAAIDSDRAKKKQGAFLSLPIGLGFKYDLSRNWTLNLEAGYRLMFTDYVDGVSKSGNTSNNDGYVYGGLMVAYRIPASQDTDGDGVKDAVDQCPTIKGSKAANGCPDKDGDGIADKMDKCPNAMGTALTEGCPDKDGDGVADKDDKCPDAKGTIATMGCPDSDEDGIIDTEDKCPNERGGAATNGCPDKDGDGVADKDDKCPDVAGVATNMGCPADSDNDGTPDAEDRCPTIAGKIKGCPDTDNDGVVDIDDKCPTFVGTIANKGCPEVAPEDKKILESAVYGVQFETGKANLTKASYPVLNKVIEVLNRYPAYHLIISGHTDNVGTDDENMTLSENRAKSCFTYLINQGVSRDRVSYIGFGKTKPVADNNTAKGRAQNRRVEFELYIK